MDTKYVKIKNGKFIIPKNIPKPRQNTAYYHRLIIGNVFISLSFLLVSRSGFEKLLFIVHHAICVLLFLVGLEFVRRLCLLAEELNHLNTRYNNSRKRLLKCVFEFDRMVYVVGFLGLLAFYTKEQFDPMLIVEWDLYALVALLFGILLMKDNMNLTKSKLYTSIRIEDMYGLDYGSSMAHSYYHGYFKIVLPPDGYTSNNLKDLMMQYESDNQIKFPVYKLYILVPLSYYCPNSLKNEWSPSILESKTLESIRRNRAGVIKREYKNSVYKILYEKAKDPIYVCAEYASPLLTFKQAVELKSEHTDTYRENTNEIIWNFYNTSRMLLENDPECRDLCELVFYNDRDDQGNYIDVGKMLYKKIVKEKMAQQPII